MLQALEAEIHEATARARRLVDSTAPRLFTVRPHPGSWSAAECLAHLTVSTAMFLPVLDEAMHRAPARPARRRSMDIIGRVLRWFLEPPIRSKVKTTAPLVPKAVRAKAEAFKEFASFQETLIEALRRAEPLDLQKVKVVSPFDRRVRYNVYSAFAIVAAHQRRHLWQAERAVETLQPPVAPPE